MPEVLLESAIKDNANYAPHRYDFRSPLATSKCQHCKADSDTGTRGGCGKCGKVKATKNGLKKHVIYAEQDFVQEP